MQDNSRGKLVVRLEDKEKLFIGGSIELTARKDCNGNVRVTISAPKTIKIRRSNYKGKDSTERN